MFRQNHVVHGHSLRTRPLLLVGLAVIGAVHLLAVGAVGHLTAWVGPVSLINPLFDALIGSIAALALFKLSHLLLFSVGLSKLKHEPAFKQREEKPSAVNLSSGAGTESR